LLLIFIGLGVSEEASGSVAAVEGARQSLLPLAPSGMLYSGSVGWCNKVPTFPLTFKNRFARRLSREAAGCDAYAT
jgi:hypothetical protein